MAQNFLACERDQPYLMPPSLREWLPDGHMAWSVLDAVAQMNLSAFYTRYRHDGWGRAAYEPQRMVPLILYSYCLGERSARGIERCLGEDVAYRVIAANQIPDHATIARFRAQHAGALAGLFGEILRLCAGARLVKVGIVAIDGTKMGANASLAASRTRQAIEADVRRYLKEAAEIDAAEDALYGEGVRGGELPPELRDRMSRLGRVFAKPRGAFKRRRTPGPRPTSAVWPSASGSRASAARSCAAESPRHPNTRRRLRRKRPIQVARS